MDDEYALTNDRYQSTVSFSSGMRFELYAQSNKKFIFLVVFFPHGFQNFLLYRLYRALYRIIYFDSGTCTVKVYLCNCPCQHFRVYRYSRRLHTQHILVNSIVESDCPRWSFTAQEERAHAPRGRVMLSYYCCTPTRAMIALQAVVVRRCGDSKGGCNMISRRRKDGSWIGDEISNFNM